MVTSQSKRRRWSPARHWALLLCDQTWPSKTRRNQRERGKKKARGAYLQQSASHTHKHITFLNWATHHIARFIWSPFFFFIPIHTHRENLAIPGKKTNRPSTRKKLQTITYYKISRITSRITNHSHTLTTSNPHSINKKNWFCLSLFFSFSAALSHI